MSNETLEGEIKTIESDIRHTVARAVREAVERLSDASDEQIAKLLMPGHEWQKARIALLAERDRLAVEVERLKESGPPPWVDSYEFIEECCYKISEADGGVTWKQSYWHMDESMKGVFRRIVRAVLETAARLAPDHVPDAGNMVERVELTDEQTEELTEQAYLRISVAMGWYGNWSYVVSDRQIDFKQAILDIVSDYELLAASAGKGEPSVNLLSEPASVDTSTPLDKGDEELGRICRAAYWAPDEGPAENLWKYAAMAVAQYIRSTEVEPAKKRIEQLEEAIRRHQNPEQDRPKYNNDQLYAALGKGTT